MKTFRQFYLKYFLEKIEILKKSLWRQNTRELAV